MRFFGNIEAKTDTKGRAFLPAVFRKVLQSAGEEHLVMAKDVFQSCLVLYPESVWNEQTDKLRLQLNRWNKAEQQLFRQYITDVELIELDGNGRFLIPRRYMQMAKIDREVKFLGLGDTIEIWSLAKAETPFVEPEAFGEALENLLGTRPNL